MHYVHFMEKTEVLRNNLSISKWWRWNLNICVDYLKLLCSDVILNSLNFIFTYLGRRGLFWLTVSESSPSCPNSKSLAVDHIRTSTVREMRIPFTHPSLRQELPVLAQAGLKLDTAILAFLVLSLWLVLLPMAL